MRSRILIITLLFTTMAFQCDDPDVNCMVNCVDIVDFVPYSQNRTGDVLTQIDTAVLKNKKLIIPVKYVGGCKEQCFGISYRYFENTVPIVELRVDQFSNCDMCEAFVLDTLNYDFNILLDNLFEEGSLDSTVKKFNIIFQNHHTRILYKF